MAVTVGGLATAAVVALGPAACSGTSADAVTSGSPSEEAAGGGTDTGGDAAAASTTTTTTEPRDELGSGETVTLAFGGDASFEGLTDSVVSNTSGLLSAIAPTLQGADLAMVNLETALGEGGTPVPKSFTFQVPEEALGALSAAGVDVVTMANNHGMDYGEAGLESSLAIRDTSMAEHSVAIVGIGRDAADAYSAQVADVKGQRIGIIAANDVFDAAVQTAWTAADGKPGIASSKAGPTQDQLVAAVTALRPEVDTLVTYLHMGREKDTCPNERQVEIADALHAAGADIVIGSHTHRLQGAGFRDGRFVAYGMGNYVFKGPSAESRKVATLLVQATGRRIDGFEWRPAVLQGNVPVPLTGASAESALAELDQRRECAGLTAEAGVGAPGTDAGGATADSTADSADSTADSADAAAEP
jgi:poly-gamma-glutamate synthesis protein (capsule biosynthesis protein)